VGRLSKEKGVEVLLEAIKIIKKSVPGILVDIVGDGPEKNMLIKLSKDLNLKNNVKFIGSIPHNIVGDFYKQCTVLIIPSVWDEPFGLVGIEAMSVGRPVIASRVGGIPEWLNDGETGYLTQSRNVEQLANKVTYLVKHPDLVRSMGKKAFARSKLFNLEEYINSLEQLYKSIIVKKYEKI